MSSRRFYTGDEQGLVKVVTITELPPVKVNRFRRRKPEPVEPQAKPVPTVETWGSPARENAIQLMCWDHAKKHLAVARKNGFVQLLDPKDGTAVTEFKQTLEKVEKNVDTIFVGLFANNESKVSTLSVGKDICRMRVHPTQHHVVATAGKEQELTLWDLSVLLKDTSSESSASTSSKKPKGKKNQEKQAPVEEPKNGNSATYKSKEILTSGQIFKAKNVKNDHLDLRVPVWNTDLQYLDSVAISKIVVGTRHHQIRVYDTKGARRPAVDAEIGTMPVVAMVNGKDSSEVVFSDTVTNVYSVLLELRQHSAATHLVTVAMDRCLRVHEMNKTRKLIHKVYLKQRMTAVVVGEFTPYETPEDDDEENRGAGDASRKSAAGGAGGSDDENVDDLWESMGKLEDKKLKKRKTTKA
ncbi:WD repeat-containing protein 74 [Podila humilis]|nr:WD repeat-containing protein 74 [Podila humilis]